MGDSGEKAVSRQDASALLQRVATGDRGAFAELFGMLAPQVKAYLIRLGSDGTAADDLVQDVMLAIWHKAPQFDPARASPMTWAFVIARNRRIDSLRREKSIFTYGETPTEIEDEAALSDEIVSGRQSDAKMRAAISSLPANQQDVIRRSFFEEEPHAAIAQALQLPLGTVKSRLRIAFTKLRKHMEDYQ